MKKMKRISLLFLVSVLSLVVLAGCSSDDSSQESNDEAKKGEVSIGYVNWADCVAMTNVAKVVLEDKMNYEVETTMAEAGVIFTSLADKSTDFFLDLWLPVTHKDYYDKYEDDLVTLGNSYDTARIGIAVPEYMDIDSLEQLNDVKDELEGQIVGIDSGAGVMLATDKAIEEYNLDYEVSTGSEPVMTAALSEAIENEKPVAVTAWDPHWKFAKWDLKFLEDPKNVYGDGEEAFTVARKGTKEDIPEVHQFMENFHLEVEEVADIMKRIEEGDNVEESARSWVKDNEDVVNKWIPKNK